MVVPSAMPLLVGALLVSSSLAPSTARAQRYFGFEVSDGRGIEAFEVLVEPGAELWVCRPTFPSSRCAALSAHELRALEARLDADASGDGVELSYVVDGEARTMALSPALPNAGRIMASIMTQCFYAGFAGETMTICDDPTRLRQVLDTASRLSTALLAENEVVRVAPQAIFTDDPADADPTDADGDNAIGLATLDALEHPRSRPASALARLLRRGDLVLVDPLGAHPTALQRAVEAARIEWFAAIERDHRCDATCGGCIPLSDRGAALEERGVRAALDVYVAALDDALWARGISVWTLDDREAASLSTALARGNIEFACGASAWGRPRFRRCAEETMHAAAERAAAAFVR